MADAPSEFLSELSWRGLVAQVTDEAGLRAHLTGAARKIYVGFDPTADSLTIGNLVPIMQLAHVQRAGHVPVVIAGGGTGLIGDPSGKSAERQLMTRERVEANVAAQKTIFSKILDFGEASANRAVLLNNADWLCELSFLDALRDIGKHFSVNMMIQKDSVRERLNNRDQGISYTEFSYMILQAYDFAHLFEQHGVTVQMGGSDQWGNIVGGIDLVRRRQAERNAGKPEGAAIADSFGLTAPLVTKADGGKFGKSETGAIWLSPERTSPYAYYQFWLNAADADVVKFLKFFTFFSKERIAELEASLASNPGAREAHRELAREATRLLHGETEVQNAEKAGKALFSGEIADLPEATLREVFANVPSSEHAKGPLAEGVPVVDLLVAAKIAKSRGEAKQFLGEGAVSMNGRKVGVDDKAGTTDLLHGSIIAIRKGKKNWFLTKWV